MELNQPGFLYGFGVFETIAIVKGELIYLNDHLNRFIKSCHHFNLHIENIEKQTIHGAMLLIKESAIENGAIRIASIKGREKSHLLHTIRTNPYESKDYTKGFRLSWSDSKRNPLSELVYHKTSNYMECLLEKERAKHNGFDEVLFG